MTKEDYFDEYKITRGGELLLVPISDKEFTVAWKMAVRFIREWKYIGKSFITTLSSSIQLPDDGDDVLDVVIPDSSWITFSDVDEISNADNLEELLRAVYLEEDLRSLVRGIVDFEYNRVSGFLEVYNYAGYQGDQCIVLYQLKEEFFEAHYLSQKERNAFIQYVYAVLDIIIGTKLRRHPDNEDGQAFIDDGNEKILTLKEEAVQIFIQPVMLIV